MRLNENIRNLRQRKNLKQKELAELAGVSRVMLGKYERGQASPSTETLQKLAEILGVTIGYLLSGENGETANDFKDETLKNYLKEIDQLSEEEKEHVKFFLDAVIVKHYRK